MNALKFKSNLKQLLLKISTVNAVNMKPNSLSQIIKKKKDQCILREELTLQYPNRGRKGFPGGSEVKNPPTMQETQVPSLGWEDPLEKETATHSRIFAWEIPMDKGAQ